MHQPAWCSWGLEEGLDLLELGLQRTVNHHVVLGNGGQGLDKSNKCSLLLNHHSSPDIPLGVILTVLELGTKEIWPRFKMFLLKPEINGLGKAKNQSRDPKGQGKVS